MTAAARRSRGDRAAKAGPPPLLPARTVTMKDGRAAMIRAVRPEDAVAIRALERAVHAGGLGVVRSMEQLPRTAAQVRKAMRPYVDGARSGVWGCWFVVEVGGRIVAGGKISRERFARIQHVAHLSLGVDPSFQELGLGRALMLAMLDWARATRDPSLADGAGAPGVNRVTLDVFANNPRAINLYSSLGFVEEGRRRRHLRDLDGAEHDDVMMALLLDEPAVPD